MRQRSVNQKAVSKLSLFLFELRGRLANNETVSFTTMYEKHGVSKSTLSALKKLGYIVEDGLVFTWQNNLNHVDKTIALKILELLRQRSDKQADTPISDLWVVEIAEIKKLITEVVHNTKKQNKLTEGFKMSDRVYIAGQIASGAYVDTTDGGFVNFDAVNNFIIKATDDLLSKLNS